jgi:hypothetical protein
LQRYEYVICRNWVADLQAFQADGKTTRTCLCIMDEPKTRKPSPNEKKKTNLVALGREKLLDGLELVQIHWESLGIDAALVEVALLWQWVAWGTADVLAILADLDQVRVEQSGGDHLLVLAELSKAVELEHDRQWNPSAISLLHGLLEELVTGKVAV